MDGHRPYVTAVKIWNRTDASSVVCPGLKDKKALLHAIFDPDREDAIKEKRCCVPPVEVGSD